MKTVDFHCTTSMETHGPRYNGPIKLEELSGDAEITP